MADLERLNVFRYINRKMEPLSDEEGAGYLPAHRQKADRWSRWAAGLTALGLILFLQSDFDPLHLVFAVLMAYFWFWTVRVATNRKAPWPNPQIPFGTEEEISRERRGEDDVFPHRDSTAPGRLDGEGDRYDPNSL